ncbi:MAG TPA: hypothetical protein DCZ95_13910 [Verrucomicrobia bacterium]|nr:MAG: hypothetical protein A2X46_01965 [Lentisphaerae bacterium GWF2_57_35]HBA85179.1 hypothetical protein [Verrucomicrobiota bacterium]
MKKTSPKEELFDLSKLTVRPLGERTHDLDLSVIRPLQKVPVQLPSIRAVANRIRKARDKKASIVLMMGAHVLRSGVQRYLIDLMEKGYISCLAMNGAGLIHDYELALIGATTESVAHYIADGQFGLWKETGDINEIVSQAAAEDLGMGYAAGRAIEEGSLPHREISVLAAGYRLGIPVTIHVGIGYDIVHEHPNCNGAAYGASSYTDFLKYTHVMERLEGGVVMNFGSSIMGPEVYLKALAMVRNVAQSEGRSIRHFATLVCDLVELPDNFRQEAPRTSPGYYYRPWKTMLVRTVADGGESFYVRAPHADTLPQLWSALQP